MIDQIVVALNFNESLATFWQNSSATVATEISMSKQAGTAVGKVE
jgi:hypothetical protein